MCHCLNKLTSKYEKRIALITLYKTRRMSESSFSHSFIAIFPYSFVSNATNFSINSLNSFVLKKAAYVLLVFFSWVPFLFLIYANIFYKCL